MPIDMHERLEDHYQGEDTYNASRRHQGTSHRLTDLAVGVYNHSKQ